MALDHFDKDEVQRDLGWALVLLMIASGFAVTFALLAIVRFAFGVN